MTKNIEKILGRTKIFKDTGKIDSIEKISTNKYKVEFKDTSYVFSILDLEEYESIENEDYISSILTKAGLKPLNIYERGVLPDLSKSYKVFEYRKENSLKDILEKPGSFNLESLGLNLGKSLKKLHSVDPDKKVDWKDKFLTRSNNVFYKHGLSQIGDKDYILTDFIESNRHLTENTPINLLYKNISPKNIRVYGNNELDLRGIKELDFGDGTRDFVEINKIAIKNPDFSKSVLKGYFDKAKASRKFFRLLALYQATSLLESLVDIREDKESYLSEFEIESILKMYDDFNRLSPSWID